MHLFQNVDHPLIIVGQALCAVGLFIYFFYIHRMANGIPAASGGLAFAMLINLYARVTHQDWFWIIDAVQYWALFVQISLVCRSKAKEKAANPAPAKPDLFDNIRERFLWTVGLIALALVVYHSATVYRHSQQADRRADQAATHENTRVTEQYQQQQAQADTERAIILAGVTSISAAQTTLLSGLHSVSMAVKTSSAQLRAGQQQLTSQVRQKTASPAPISHPDTTDGQTSKPPLQQPPKPNIHETPKKSLWHRIFGGTAAEPDSSIRVSTDTLYNYRALLLPAGPFLSGFGQPLPDVVFDPEKNR